jgi:hypothetical protein
MLLRVLHGRQSDAGPGGVTLTYANTGLYWASTLGGGGYAYRRPISVRPPGADAEIPIRDHVMILRLALILVLAVTTLWRWVDGR